MSAKAAAEALTLRTRLESNIKQLQEKVCDAESQNQQLTARVNELQGALAQKAASMSDALNELQEGHGHAMIAAEQSFADAAAAKDQAHSRSISALQVMMIVHASGPAGCSNAEHQAHRWLI